MFGLKLPAQAAPAGNPDGLLRRALDCADAHLLAYGHDMTWLAGHGRYAGTCKGCRGRVCISLDGAGVPRVTAQPAMASGADYTECPSVTRPGLTWSRRRQAEGAF